MTAKNNNRNKVRVCDQCGKEYSGFISSKLFCSNSCKREWHIENPPEDPRTCKGCNKALPLSDFRRSPNGTYDWKCKPCAYKVALPSYLKRRAKKDEIREESYRRLYGIGIVEYEQMFKDQKGACAICKGTDPRTKAKRLAIDHCHTTKEVRGLLCSPCNMAIGLFADNLERMISAVNYLGKMDLLEDLLMERQMDEYHCHQEEMRRGK